MTKNTAVEITVTKKNLDVAYAAAKAGKDLTTTCLLAQAIKQAFPKKRVSVSSDYAEVGKKYFDLPRRAQKLIDRFDALPTWGDPTKAEKSRVTKLRDTLPVTFTMTEQVVEEAVAAAA